MRRHRTYPVFDIWDDAARLKRVVSAETLIVARIEPMMRQANGFGVADLTFARDGETAVVPFVHIEAGMLAEPERGAFVWPQSAAKVLDDRTADAIETLILPRLLARYLGRTLNRETVLAFGDPAPFERARSYGFLGATPYDRVAEATAPYLYAMRLAVDAHVCVADAPEGATGAALLTRAAASVHAGFGGDEILAAARAWYGDVFSPMPAACDLAIGAAGASLPDAPARVLLRDDGAGAIPIARAIPVDVLFSFDPEDSERAGGFSIVAPEPELRRSSVVVPAAVGGSGGRLLFAIRNDGVRAPDADTDDAQALARRLRGEGFEVDVVPASDVADPSAYDLLHAFGLTAAADLGPLLKRAREAGLPVVATARLDDIAREGVWGAKVASGAAQVTVDEELDDHLRAIADRRIETTGAKPSGQEPYDGYTADVTAAIGDCDVVLVSGADEERFVRERFAYAGAVAPVGPALFAPAAASIGGLVGSSDFVLAHVPIAARANLLALARAAEEAGLPLVIAGPVAEAGYLALLREAAGIGVALVTTADEERIRTLYRRARVFADVGWEDRGPARAAAAAMSGAALVLAKSHYAARLWWPGLWTADRASIPSVASALRAAWDGAGAPDSLACAGRVAAYCDPVMTLTGVVAAYARAQTLRSGA